VPEPSDAPGRWRATPTAQQDAAKRIGSDGSGAAFATPELNRIWNCDGSRLDAGSISTTGSIDPLAERSTPGSPFRKEPERKNS